MWYKIYNKNGTSNLFKVDLIFKVIVKEIPEINNEVAKEFIRKFNKLSCND